MRNGFLISWTYCFLVAAIAEQCGACPQGWQSQHEGKCLLFFNETKSWDKAEEFCNNQSGHLAAVTSEKQLEFIKRLCQGNSNGCWLGGRTKITSNGLNWSWSNTQTDWNATLFKGETSLKNCSGKLCSHPELCTVVTPNGTVVEVDNCNISHAFVCMLIEDSKCEYRSCHKEYNIILAAVSVVIFTATCCIAVWLLLLRQTKRWRKSSSAVNVELVPASWRVFSFNELREATKNFSDANMLSGDSRSGITYKGGLADGSLVAIMRLTGNFKWNDGLLSQNKNYRSLNEQEFRSEIGRIARYRHPNLVVVRGCCFKHGQKYIVYDFMPNGSLDRWLHNVPKGAKSLDWTIRMRIAVTLAQGIAFLHDKVKPHVVHRDIRASNVLLDEGFRSHILGVGLAKFVPWEAIHERTVMGGAYGYLAPEVVLSNELTTKSDVYSFGVLLLELISGRMPAQNVDSADYQSIFEWATPLVQSNEYTQLLDPSMTDIPDTGEIQKVVDLVYACTQHVPSMRPRMSYVVHQLQQLVSVKDHE